MKNYACQGHVMQKHSLYVFCNSWLLNMRCCYNMTIMPLFISHFYYVADNKIFCITTPLKKVKDTYLGPFKISLNRNLMTKKYTPKKTIICTSRTIRF